MVGKRYRVVSNNKQVTDALHAKFARCRCSEEHATFSEVNWHQTESYNIEPHEAVPEVSRSKVHITQNKHVPIEWFVTTASQSRI